MPTGVPGASVTLHQGSLTCGLDTQADEKLSSPAKSISIMSSLQEESQGLPMARLFSVMGAGASGTSTMCPVFFQIRPIRAMAAAALSSIRPSRLGAALRI